VNGNDDTVLGDRSAACRNNKGNVQTQSGGPHQGLELITRAVASRAQVVVTGPAGGGKSALVHETALRVHAEGRPAAFLAFGVVAGRGGVGRD
jgi:excinuclease UvrABC ATPase subunit